VSLFETIADTDALPGNYEWMPPIPKNAACSSSISQSMPKDSLAPNWSI